ncbi:MAG: M20/M25/M40 family metallo-hydrolase, partial [Neisseriaceae bacterium]|nr:M20/M25/M40 family metallo-hydrolase [Neisseriaceae bacterium]
MNSLQQLQPSLLWKWFAQICTIPHPSYHEQELAQYIVNWAKQQNLWVEQDSVGNVLIRKPASNGQTNASGILLQAHLDMVSQKNDDSSHDFLKDPIETYIEDGWVKAKGTTLGADNGIGLASALAILESDDIFHPPLEVLLTVTEETGMVGAIELQSNWLQSSLMVNTDSEVDSEICIGCAGGVDAD